LITVAFRLDDPSETSNQDVEAGILDALRVHQATCTFAVIPFRMFDGRKTPLSVARARPLVRAAEEGLIEPALHGYIHASRYPELAPPSEFSGLSHDEQRSMIKEGRAHLETVFGMEVSGFIPPWNSYDGITVEVLEQEGLRYLSASWLAPLTPRRSLRILPFTARLGLLSQALNEAAAFTRANPVIVIVMHHYDFAESGSDQASTNTNEFSNLLSCLTSRSDIRIQTLAEISNSMACPDLPIRQHRFRSRHHFMSHLLPRLSFVNNSPWRDMLAKMLSL
jgi:predicted deacetylase